MTTIDELEARITDLEGRIGPVPLAANPPVTIGELADVPAPGSAILSAWTQEVSRRIVHRFATVAARDAAYPAALAGPGAVSYTFDTGTVWAVNGAGTAWAAIGWATRMGGTWARGTGLPVPNNANTGVTFELETFDIGNFAPPVSVGTPAGTFTVPPGGGGLYAINFTFYFQGAITNSFGWVNAGGRTSQRNPTEPVSGYGNVVIAPTPLLAGDQIQAAVYQNSGAARTLTANMDIWRTGP